MSQQTSSHNNYWKNHSPPPFTGAIIRGEDHSWAVQNLTRGECCSIVGTSNSGKSSLLRMLVDQSALDPSWHPLSHPPLLVFIDCLDCAGDSELALFELILRRIQQTMQESCFNDDYVSELEDLRNDLLRANNPVAIRAHFAISMHTIGCIPHINLVLIFDEFDDVFRTQSPWPFRQLRAIRDTLGKRLCYLTATSRYLKDLRSDAETYEFRELFQMNTRVLKTLSIPDQQSQLNHLEKNFRITLSPEHRSLIQHLSGGHPGFLTRIALQLNREESVDHPSGASGNQKQAAGVQEICRRLLQYQPLKDECRRLWTELEPQEQKGLMILAAGSSSTKHSGAEKRLTEKGLVTTRPEGGSRIFSPLLESFLQQEADYFLKRAPRGVRSNDVTGQIWVDGKEITIHLSEYQRKLLRCLHEKIGVTCTHQEIINAVWGSGEGVTPGAVYELVKRVRKKVENDWKNPQYLVTVPGEGYRLEKVNPTSQ